MKKSNLFLLVDVLMFLFLAIMSGLGLMIKYILVPGSKRWVIYGRNVDLTFLGWDRHQWGTVHLICAILFVAFLVLHIILHWKNLKSYLRKIVNTNAESNLIIITFAFLLFFIIIFPFIINIKVTEMGDGRDRFLYGGEHQQIPAAVQRIQQEKKAIPVEKEQAVIKETIKTTEEKESGFERHDIDPDIEVLGSMSLIDVSLRYNVPVSYIIKELDLPASVSGNEKLGRLRRSYGFTMSDIKLIIHNYRRK
ncbi:MAG TPA: hypothetical protein DEQ09_01940 [Bacteroidales bacterium]|nr:hypothetical protein [Bacteroidales bacterium]